MKPITILLLAVTVISLIAVAAFVSAASLSRTAAYDNDAGQGFAPRQGCGGQNGMMQGMHQWMMGYQYQSQNGSGCIHNQNGYNWSYEQNCTGNCQAYQYDFERCYEWNNSQSFCGQY